MNYFIVFSTFFVILFLFHFFYQKKRHTALSDKKPLLKFFPKYFIQLNIENLDIKQLESKMESFGFNQKLKKEDCYSFSRGSVLGDFTIKITKVNIDFEKPLQNGSRAFLSYGNFAPTFDTGDLWKFSQELKTKIEM